MEPADRVASERDVVSLWNLLFVLRYVFLICSICGLVGCYLQLHAEMHNPNNSLPIERRIILPDLMIHWSLLLVPRSQATFSHVCDYLFFVTIALAIFSLKTHMIRPDKVLRRSLLTWGFLFLTRGFTINMTYLPFPLETCTAIDLDGNFLILAVKIFTYQLVTCGDVFFSAHMIGFTITASAWARHGAHGALRAIAITLSVMGAIALLLLRYHYTIDVFVSFCFTLAFWHIYHLYVDNQSIERGWLRDIILWLDSIGEVPSEIESTRKLGSESQQLVAHTEIEAVHELACLNQGSIKKQDAF